MKKFFTIIPLQKENDLISYNYKCSGNKHLEIDEKIAFPILSEIAANVLPGESYTLVSVLTDNEDAKRNSKILKKQLEELAEKRKLKAPVFEEIVFPEEDSVSRHLTNFQQLIDYVADEDELYFCMTYGTKPLSQVLMMAMRYAREIKKNTVISGVVYGKITRNGSVKEDWDAQLYDMTALIQMEGIITKLSERHLQHPEEAVRHILNIE